MRWFVVLSFCAIAVAIAVGMNFALSAAWPSLAQRPLLFVLAASVVGSLPWFVTVAALFRSSLVIILVGAVAFSLAIGANLALLAAWPAVMQSASVFVPAASVLAAFPWLTPLLALWQVGSRRRAERRAVQEDLVEARKGAEAQSGEGL